MEELLIFKYQLEHVKEVLRLTKNLYDKGQIETCYKRQLNKAIKFVDETLKNNQ